MDVCLAAHWIREEKNREDLVNNIVMPIILILCLPWRVFCADVDEGRYTPASKRFCEGVREDGLSGAEAQNFRENMTEGYVPGLSFLQPSFRTSPQPASRAHVYMYLNPVLYGCYKDNAAEQTSAWLGEMRPPPEAESYRASPLTIDGQTVRVLFPVDANAQEQEGPQEHPAAVLANVPEDCESVRPEDILPQHGSPVPATREEDCLSEDASAFDGEEGVRAQMPEALDAIPEDSEYVVPEGIASQHDSPVPENFEEDCLSEGASAPDLGEGMREKNRRRVQEVWDANHKRQKLLLDYLQERTGKHCLVKDLLSYSAIKDYSKDVLWEDVVALIHTGHNIRYDNQGGREAFYFSREQLMPPEMYPHYTHAFCSLWKGVVFRQLSVGRQTYILYSYGYTNVPLSTVALMVSVKAEARLVQDPNKDVGKCENPGLGMQMLRWDRILAVQNKILEDKEILCAFNYSNGQFGHGAVTSRDLSTIKRGLGLHSTGSVLVDMFAPQAIKRHRNVAKGETIHQDPVIAYLAQLQEPCSEEDLRRKVETTSRHGYRDFVRTIVSLRADQHNIVHNEDGTFELRKEERVVRPGFFSLFLWQALDQTAYRELGENKILLRLSDLGFNPVANAVNSVILLKRLMSDIPDFSLPEESVVRKVWEMVLRENALYSRSYYKTKISGADSVTTHRYNTVKTCVRVYNFLMYGGTCALAGGCMHRGLREENDGQPIRVCATPAGKL